MMIKLTNDEIIAILKLMIRFKDSGTDSGRAIATLMRGLDAGGQGVTGSLDLEHRAYVGTMIKNPYAVKVASRMIYSGLDIEEAIAHENKL